MALEPAPAPTAPDEAVVRWVLQALATARATGAPALGCLAGIRARPASAGCVELGFAPPPAPQGLGLLEVAMVADLALGGALRARVGRDRPLPTLSLTIALTAAPSTTAGLTARTADIAIDDGIGTASAVLLDDNVPIGHASATFAIPTWGSHPVLPWDRPEPMTSPAPLRRQDLTAAEHAALHAVLHAESARNGESCGDRLVRESSVTRVAPGMAGFRFTPTPVATNRAGAVQGAVLFALAAQTAAAAAAATTSAAGTGAQLTSGTIRFISGVEADTDVLADATVERATHRTVFVRSQLTQVAVVRAGAGFIFRRPR